MLKNCRWTRLELLNPLICYNSGFRDAGTFPAMRTWTDLQSITHSLLTEQMIWSLRSQVKTTHSGGDDANSTIYFSISVYWGNILYRFCTILHHYRTFKKSENGISLNLFQAAVLPFCSRVILGELGGGKEGIWWGRVPILCECPAFSVFMAISFAFM